MCTLCVRGDSKLNPTLRYEFRHSPVSSPECCRVRQHSSASWQVGFFKTPSAWPSSDLNNFLATFLMRNECGLDCSNGCFNIQHRLILPNSQIGLDLRNQPCNGSMAGRENLDNL